MRRQTSLRRASPLKLSDPPCFFIAHIRDSIRKSLIKANSQLQGLADDFRLPLNRGLKHFISQERLESTSSGKHQNEIASLL
jgi:hypothetical protein